MAHESHGVVAFPAFGRAILPASTGAYQSSPGVLVLAAVPAKVSCAPKMEPGCRALKIKYSKSNGTLGPLGHGLHQLDDLIVRVCA